MVRVIVFDFDGVLVPGSEAVKRAAWVHVFASRGERAVTHAQEYVTAYMNGKGDRFDIIRSVLTRLGEMVENMDEAVGKLSSVFDDFVQKGIADLAVSGATVKVLQDLSSTHTLYVNSATPEVSLIRTIEQLGIRQYFKGVYGRPHTKVSNLVRIGDEAGVSKDEMLFVGDSSGDLFAAREFGCSFIGLANDENGWGDARDFSEPVISDLGMIREFLNKGEGVESSD